MVTCASEFASAVPQSRISASLLPRSRPFSSRSAFSTWASFDNTSDNAQELVPQTHRTTSQRRHPTITSRIATPPANFRLTKGRSRAIDSRQHGDHADNLLLVNQSTPSGGKPSGFLSEGVVS